MLKVQLHSNEPSAVDATDQTLKMLGFDTHLARDESGAVVFDESGYAQIETTNPLYIKFAITRQGYVAAVK